MVGVTRTEFSMPLGFSRFDAESSSKSSLDENSHSCDPTLSVLLLPI